MICCETKNSTSNIGSSSSPPSSSFAFMYRNLPSDTTQSSNESNFFSNNYNQRLNQTQAYVSSNYGGQPGFVTGGNQSQGTSGHNPDYSSQFFVSDLNSHFHGDGSAGHCTWGQGSLYSAETLATGINQCNSWDPTTQPFHSHGASSIPNFPVSASSGHSSILEAGDISNLPPASLAAIDCFSNVSEVGSSVGVHLPSIQHRSLPSQRRPYEWINKNAYQNPQTQQGKTRTKDKYRVVYSDHQRLELEKEFRFSRYITIRRKAELASQLCLSERQVKIWFQNRRAKERKASKKNTGLNTATSEDQEGIDDGDVSENSTQEGESPVPITSVSSNQLSPTQHNLLLSLNQSATSSGSDCQSKHLQGGSNKPCHSSHMQYAYQIESPRHQSVYGSMSPEIDIKPLLTGSNDIEHVRGNIDNIETTEELVATSPAEHDIDTV